MIKLTHNQSIEKFADKNSTFLKFQTTGMKMYPFLAFKEQTTQAFCPKLKF
jgi:hypothetical protein